MSLTPGLTLRRDGRNFKEWDYVASGAAQAVNMGPRIISVTINEVGGGGAVGTEIGRISGIYAILSGVTSGTTYKVNIEYI